MKTNMAVERTAGAQAAKASRLAQGKPPIITDEVFLNAFVNAMRDAAPTRGGATTSAA